VPFDKFIVEPFETEPFEALPPLAMSSAPTSAVGAPVGVDGMLQRTLRDKVSSDSTAVPVPLASLLYQQFPEDSWQ
jgi:hypothetical protein